MKQKNSSGNGKSQKSEKSMVTISLVIVLVDLLDWVLWYNTLAFNEWWVRLLLTLTEITMYMMNAFLISLLSSEIYEKTFFTRFRKFLPNLQSTRVDTVGLTRTNVVPQIKTSLPTVEQL